MRVLVTGAAGFIGRHVCLALNDAGHTVIGMDVVPPPREAFSRVSAINNEWIAADITQPLPKIDNLDAVIHLAAVSHPRACDNDPALAFNANVNGTHQVLKMAQESGAKKIVFSSSAHVYDIPPKYLPTDEIHPLRLNNTYTTTKILGEQLCHLYYENHGLSYTTLRLFNAYGPGQALGFLIPDLIRKAEKGHIDLSGANTTKDWIYVEDVARAFVLALSTAFVGAINIGSGYEAPLSVIANYIAHKKGATVSYTQTQGATRMLANPRRALRVLGWKPTKTLLEGLDAIFSRQPVEA